MKNEMVGIKSRYKNPKMQKFFKDIYICRIVEQDFHWKKLHGFLPFSLACLAHFGMVERSLPSA